MSRYSRHEDQSSDYPIYSRLFIICEKRITENDIREEFTQFGTIEDIRMPRDRSTGEPRGIVYIKFSKTSEAACALEAMHGKIIKNSNRPLRVLVAANRNDIQSDEESTEKYTRLFLTVRKPISEDDIREDFSKYGHIELLELLKDRQTGEPKGFAYVKYRNFSEAAYAFEECDRKYRAIFATPRGSNRRTETSFESNVSYLANTSSNISSMMSMMTSRPGGFTKVNFMCSPYLTQMHVEALFDIVPGMVFCQYFVDLIHHFGKGTVTYSNQYSAAYAVEKLNKFEYPLGSRIFVKPNNCRFDENEKSNPNIPSVTNNLRKAINAASSSTVPDLAQLAEAIAEASKLIKVATAGVTNECVPDSNDLHYCSVKLPPPKPLADIDSNVAKRCFLVCKPQPPPLLVLRDVFCRFGDLITVYTLPNKTVGYACYASEKSADDAIATLHGAEIYGVRIKVLEAEEESAAKKRRIEN